MRLEKVDDHGFPLATLLGLAVFQIVGDDVKVQILTKDATPSFIGQLTRAGQITADEAGVLQRSIEESEMLPRFEDLFDLVASATIADAEHVHMEMEFRYCDLSTFPERVNRGHIWADGRKVSGKISTLCEALEFCWSAAAAAGELAAKQALLLLQQIVSADLAIDREEIGRRYFELPEDERNRLEALAAERAATQTVMHVLIMDDGIRD